MECRLLNEMSGVGETYPLREGITNVGRDSDNDIQIMSEGVSRHHARFNKMPTICELEDMESTNGTYVNGDRITDCVLRDGDEIRIGDVVLRFEGVDAGSYTAGAARSYDYSERTRFDTIKMQAVNPRDIGLSDKTKTSSMKPVSPLKPKSDT